MTKQKELTLSEMIKLAEKIEIWEPVWPTFKDKRIYDGFIGDFRMRVERSTYEPWDPPHSFLVSVYALSSKYHETFEISQTPNHYPSSEETEIIYKIADKKYNQQQKSSRIYEIIDKRNKKQKSSALKKARQILRGGK